MIVFWVELSSMADALGINLRLIPNRLEARDAILERWVVEIGDTALDRVIEALETDRAR